VSQISAPDCLAALAAVPAAMSAAICSAALAFFLAGFSSRFPSYDLFPNSGFDLVSGPYAYRGKKSDFPMALPVTLLQALSSSLSVLLGHFVLDSSSDEIREPFSAFFCRFLSPLL
jgi:hypothetical protein